VTITFRSEWERFKRADRFMGRLFGAPEGLPVDYALALAGRVRAVGMMTVIMFMFWGLSLLALPSEMWLLPHLAFGVALFWLGGQVYPGKEFLRFPFVMALGMACVFGAVAMVFHFSGPEFAAYTFSDWYALPMSLLVTMLLLDFINRAILFAFIETPTQKARRKARREARRAVEHYDKSELTPDELIAGRVLAFYESVYELGR